MNVMEPHFHLQFAVNIGALTSRSVKCHFEVFKAAVAHDSCSFLPSDLLPPRNFTCLVHFSQPHTNFHLLTADQAEPDGLAELMLFFCTLPHSTSVCFPSENMAAGGACPGSQSQHSPPLELFT